MAAHVHPLQSSPPPIRQPPGPLHDGQPDLPAELVERILAVTVHLSAAPAPGHKDATTLYPVLNAAGPRSAFPDITKTAIARVCWWIDHDFASRLGNIDLLRVLDSMAAVRPLQWSKRAMDQASAHGHVHVLEYWLRVKGAVRCVFTDQAVVGAARNGHKRVLQWWIGVPDMLELPRRTIVEELAFGGHCDLIQWWTAEFADKLRSPPISVRVLAHAIAGAYSRPESSTSPPPTAGLSTFDWLVSTYGIGLAHRAFASALDLQPINDLLMNAAMATIHTSSRDLASATIQMLERYDLVVALGPLAMLASIKSGDLTILERICTRLFTTSTRANSSQAFNTMYRVASMLGDRRALDWLHGKDKVLREDIVLRIEAPDLIFGCVAHAAKAGNVDSLDWWLTSEFWPNCHGATPMHHVRRILNAAIMGAATNDHAHVLQWFWENVRECRESAIMWPDGIMSHASRFGAVKVLDWLVRDKARQRMFSSDGNPVDVASSSGQLGSLEFWQAQVMVSDKDHNWRKPFTDRDEDQDSIRSMRVGGGGLVARDEVFAWWIQSGMAKVKSLDVLVALAFSRYPILLHLYLRKYGWPSFPTLTMFDMSSLKWIVLPTCAERGGGYRCVAEYWVGLDIENPAWWTSNCEQQKAVDQMMLGLTASFGMWAGVAAGKRTLLFSPNVY